MKTIEIIRSEAPQYIVLNNARHKVRELSFQLQKFKFEDKRAIRIRDDILKLHNVVLKLETNLKERI